MTWRVGRKLGRTLYLQAGEAPDCGIGTADTFLGLMDTPQLAALVCLCVNTMEELGITLEAQPEAEAFEQVAPQVVRENSDSKESRPPAGPPVQRSIKPPDTGRAITAMNSEYGLYPVPEHDRAVADVPPDADLPVVELDPGGDDTDTRDT